MRAWLASRLITRLMAMLLSLLCVAPALSQVVLPDERQGDGRVSEFYRWAGPVAGRPGTLLRKEVLPTTIGLTSAAAQYRILYVSTDGLKGSDATVVSGALFLPRGTPPKGGWPLVSWGHGTVGVADICAPSWQGRSWRDIRYLNRWLDEGFAVVATDYQGLGTPGGHPLLNNRVAAYGILDAARAALSGFPGIANKVLIVGQSQGGAGAVAAAAYAPNYAPDIGVRGTVATGVIYNPPGTNRASRSGSDLDKVDETIAYQFYSILSAQQLDSSVDAGWILTPETLPFVEQARSTCLFALEADVVGAGLTRRTTLRADGDPQALDRWFATFVSYPTLKLEHPLFVGAGGTDGSTTATTQLALVKAACEAGSVVEAHVYAGLDHSGAVNASLVDSIPFARKAIAGDAIANRCGNPGQGSHP